MVKRGCEIVDITLLSMDVKIIDKSISFTYDLDGEKWYLGSDIARMIGYEKTRNAIATHVDSHNKRSVDVCRFLQNGESHKVNSTYTFINSNGVSQLVSGSRLIDGKTKALILGEFGISNIILPKDTKELQFFELLSKSTEYEVIRQYKVDNYILDGYIRELNIAIEYDENYHKYDNQYINDRYRENYIKNKLKCRFIRLSEDNSAKENVELLLSFIEDTNTSKETKCSGLSYVRILLKDINYLRGDIICLTNENNRLKKIVKYFLDRDKKEFMLRNDIKEIPTDNTKYRKFLKDITSRLVSREPIYKEIRVPDYYDKEEDFYA